MDSPPNCKVCGHPMKREEQFMDGAIIEFWINPRWKIQTIGNIITVEYGIK